MKKIGIILSIVIAIIIVVYSCNRDDEETYNGQLAFEFEHLVNGNPAVFDQMVYENAAGNQYEITNIQWFISELSLVNASGNERIVSSSDWVHYIDTDLPSTMKWVIMEGINPDEFQGIKFIFGIKGEKNKPLMFTDPPESNMIWPYHMGGDEGGYHYMKLNGFWKDLNGDRTPFNFHMGVGQEYDENGIVVGFYQNWFEVEIPKAFSMPAGGFVTIKIQMNIENWFRNPHNYDHEIFGGSIMNNQDAMGQIHDNGQDVFSINIE